MSEAPELAVVAQGELCRLKETLRVLERGGIEARILAPPDARANA